MAVVTGAVAAVTWIALQTGAVVTLREILKRPELLKQAISWTVSRAKPTWSRLVTNAGKPTKHAGVHSATSTTQRTILAKKAWQEQIYNHLAQNNVKVTPIIKRQVKNAAEKLRNLTDKPSPNEVAAYKRAMNPLNMPSTFDRQLREKYFIATVGTVAAEEIIRLWDTVPTEEPIGYEPSSGIGGMGSYWRPPPTIPISVAEESALARVKHFDQPRLLTASSDVRGPFETPLTQEERKLIGEEAVSEARFTKEDATRIANTLARQGGSFLQDPSQFNKEDLVTLGVGKSGFLPRGAWKNWFAKEQEKGFLPSEPSLLDRLKISDKEQEEMPDTQRSRLKKGGSVKKKKKSTKKKVQRKITKTYANNTRKPKRA